ncbi:glycoside hydrolase family 47 protein [Saccharata proteae CBS 121410]|uniref:alpha-1,2-Mannosidase n=1 Tax=Saccharata proteae CBS 121410 TaxID=1314787 RepID=A0A9P4HTD5_9PEZI|nr:glycoside hydrolase family 47 protein [Saccharata proteae CBS 121410]
MPAVKRTAVFVAIAVVLALYHVSVLFDPAPQSPVPLRTYADRDFQQPLIWSNVPEKYPVSSMVSLPKASPTSIPRIQNEFAEESSSERAERLQRLQAVKESFLHSWTGYKKHAWLQDEVAPLSGNFKNTFGGWGASLVDALDTLCIMGLKKEFAIAVKALDKIDFSSTDMDRLNVFETTIRYLGGLMSAYDLSNGKYPVLLEKATELGEMLYRAFDTPNRMPVSHWYWKKTYQNGTQEAQNQAVSAEIGSLSLEFTRLSQLSGDHKYYDAIQRISDEFFAQQNQTRLPGLWPVYVNPKKTRFTDDKTFTFGGMSDSLYEYFPKQYMLLGGVMSQYREMYENAIEVAKRHMFYRPMNPQNADILLSGSIFTYGVTGVKLNAEGQHLACFVGGMVGIAAKIFNRSEDLDVARKLTDGCIWAYESMPTGIMPEVFHAVACENATNCPWDGERWYQGVAQRNLFKAAPDMTPEERARKYVKKIGLPEGFTDLADRRYILRPEAIESVFIMYRITGDKTLQDKAWNMFQAVDKYTRTEIGNAAINDVGNPEKVRQVDSCESFWMAETLKYYYLIFSEPDVVSLDEWVFNTEAHPLRRPTVEV